MRSLKSRRCYGPVLYRPADLVSFGKDFFEAWYPAITMVAPLVKDPAFAKEREWIMQGLMGTNGAHASEIRFEKIGACIPQPADGISRTVRFRHTSGTQDAMRNANLCGVLRVFHWSQRVNGLAKADESIGSRQFSD